MNIYPAQISKHYSNREENDFNFNDFKWRKVALSCDKKLSALRRITSKNGGDFYCLNCIKKTI